MPKHLTIPLLALAFTLGAVACSDDSDDTASDDTTADAGSDDTASDDTSADTEPADTTTTTEAGPCPSETTLEILNSEGLDGEMDIVTEFADVTLGESADLVFATYEIEEDPQFGLSAPVGDPGAPDGGLIFQVSLDGDGEIVAGEYPDDDDAAARISFISMYNGSERINPLGDHTLTITEITEEQICGEITGVGETDLQSFPYLEGTFVVPAV